MQLNPAPGSGVELSPDPTRTQPYFTVDGVQLAPDGGKVIFQGSMEELLKTINGGNAVTQPLSRENEVYMLLLEVENNDDGTGVYRTTPVSYNFLGSSEDGARALTVNEASEDPAEFVDVICDELDNLVLNLINNAIRADIPHHEAYVKFLADFQQQPVELIHNMLAAMLVGSMDGVREELESAELLGEDKPDLVPVLGET